MSRSSKIEIVVVPQARIQRIERKKLMKKNFQNIKMSFQIQSASWVPAQRKNTNAHNCEISEC